MDTSIRYGCIFCGHRQDSDAVCSSCHRDRTLDLTDSSIRDFFRETEASERKKREDFAKMIGVIVAMIVLAACIAIQVWLRVLRRRTVAITIVAPLGAAVLVAGLLERALHRRRFPWLDELDRIRRDDLREGSNTAA
jgi:hypothetical protein